MRPTVCKVCNPARRTPDWQLATGDRPPATVCNSGPAPHRGGKAMYPVQIM